MELESGIGIRTLNRNLELGIEICVENNCNPLMDGFGIWGMNKEVANEIICDLLKSRNLNIKKNETKCFCLFMF